MNRRAFLGGLAALSGAAVAARFYRPEPGVIAFREGERASISQRLIQQYQIGSDQNFSRLDVFLGAPISRRHRASKSARRYARRMKALSRRGLVA